MSEKERQIWTVQRIIGTVIMLLAVFISNSFIGISLEIKLLLFVGWVWLEISLLRIFD
jgi:hypothetical protein